MERATAELGTAGQPAVVPLARLVDGLCRAASPEEAFERGLDAGLAALGLTAGTVVLSDETGALRCRSSRGLTERARTALEAYLANVHEPGPAAASNGLGSLLASEGLRCAGLFPLRREGRPPGWLALFSGEGPLVNDKDVALATLIAAQLERALLVGDLRASQRQLEEAADRNADRVSRLTRIATALSSASTAEQVSEIIISEAQQALHADWSGVYLLDAKQTTLSAVATVGVPEPMRTRHQSFKIDDPNPLSLAVVENQAIWLENWEDYARRFPFSEGRVRATAQPTQMAFACLPLQIEDKTIGGLVLSFFKERPFPPEERAFMSLFARHCAQGIERARLYDQAMDAVRVREDFLSVAGHELRTPLATLLLQIQLKAEAAAGTRESFGPMQRTLRRLIRLADDVLDVSRIRAGRLRLEREPVELCALVREVATRTALALQRSDKDLLIETAGPIEGRWDPLRLEQILVNLITNACKYGGDRPIQIKAAPCPEGAEIRVRDQGIGIALEDQARIFQRFERSVDSQAFSGLGLGLWIVREIVAAHQGSITVKSEPGAGAEFCVRLPLEVVKDATGGSAPRS